MNPNNSSELNSQWLDFYALLGVEPDTDKDELRRKIGATYAEASANCDHRDLNRRHYFQTMVERVLPQCRRVLLDPDLRAAYDEQSQLHRNGDPNALDYVTFMASLQNGGKAPDANSRSLDAPADAVLGAVSDDQTSTAAEFDALPERVREEINLARQVLECVQSGEELDFIPARTLFPAKIGTTSVTDESAPSESAPSETTPVESAPVESALPLPRHAPRPRPRPPAEPYYMDGDNIEQENSVQETPSALVPSATARVTPPDAAPNASGVTEISDDTEPVIRARVLDTQQHGSAKTLAELREEAAQRAISAGIATPQTRENRETKAPKAYQPRVVVEDEWERSARESHAPKTARKSVLTPLSTYILTAIAAAFLTWTILRNDTPAAPPVARVPLSVVYVPQLGPLMQISKQQFEASPAGAGVDIVLQPLDSQSALRQVLGAKKNAPDVWIPSEAMWSERYNRAAAKAKVAPINSDTQLALSPLILAVRSDHAAALGADYPNHKIDSWAALQNRIKTSSSNHFGLSDPQKSGAGALVRYLMAREWCAKNKVPFNANAMSDARLWQWLSGFESNVPEWKMPGETLQDLALATTGQFWWTLAYESDAIAWIGKGKKIEIFYLPATYYAEYPFCHIERPDDSRAIATARVRFESFLHSPPMQATLLQNGFRAPGIDLKSAVAGNPFIDKGYEARGVRAGGVVPGPRVDNRILDALTAQWAKRYHN